MPEGPELYKAARLVNTECEGKIFQGKIVRSAVNLKSPEIHRKFNDYTIHAESCGKEMALILTAYPPIDTKSNKKGEEKTSSLRILFRFGMSGKFQFTKITDIHKHAHLSFFTKQEPAMVLSFVDVRRFGRWEVTDSWSENRGPDPLLDYRAFRDNVVNSLEDSVFSKPLCEVMHNQKYFNGIGNYLRAEIIYRAGIPPFTAARKVFADLIVKEELDSETKKPKNVDILQLCNIVPNEVIQLPGAGYDPSGDHSDYSAFRDWLQCYSNPNMKNLIDHDGRTMWFKGEAGPLAPKGGKTRTVKRYGKHKVKEKNGELGNEKVKPKRKVKQEKKAQVKKEKKDAPKKGATKSEKVTTISAKNSRKRKLSTAIQVTEMKPVKVPRKSSTVKRHSRKTASHTEKVEITKRPVRQRSAPSRNLRPRKT